MRPSNDANLLDVARLMSRRGTCSRLQVGAVLARDTRVIGSGWNGAPAGLPHCAHDGSEQRCATAVHAEMNAIGYAAREGVATGGATLYVTHSPCEHCAPVVIAAGIARVVYGEHYRSDAGVLRLRAAGIQVENSAESGLTLWPL